MASHILIHNGTVLTMETDRPVIENGWVMIQNHRIQQLGTGALPGVAGHGRVIDAGGGIIMPGLVNAHIHAPMSMFRGLADDLPLDVWLNAHIFPAEARQVNPDSVARWTRHSCHEMLLSGTTTCCDGYFFETEVARAMATTGIRAVAAQGVIDFPAPGVPDPQENVRHAIDHVTAVKELGSRITPSIFCHSAYTCSSKTLVAGKDAARDAGVLFQIHAAEVKHEPEMIKENNGESVIQYLDRLGILDKQTLVAHGVWVDETDLTILARCNTPVVHCPESNMKLASGIAPVPKMLGAGVQVALGTDGCASNNDLDMFSEMGTAAKLHKVACMDPCVMDAKTCLTMATMGGARALGMGREIGSLAPGKKADIIVVDTAKPHMQPMHNPFSGLVYSAKSSDVSWVIVDGIVRVAGGKLA
jgi:5-methylthioadenosine/S-adenosylhomocysteine deaminase